MPFSKIKRRFLVLAVCCRRDPGRLWQQPPSRGSRSGARRPPVPVLLCTKLLEPAAVGRHADRPGLRPDGRRAHRRGAQRGGPRRRSLDRRHHRRGSGGPGSRQPAHGPGQARSSPRPGAHRGVEGGSAAEHGPAVRRRPRPRRLAAGHRPHVGVLPASPPTPAWEAEWGGAMEHVSSNPGVYGPGAWPGAQSYWGVTAGSLPLVGGAMTVSAARGG